MSSKKNNRIKTSPTTQIADHGAEVGVHLHSLAQSASGVFAIICHPIVYISKSITSYFNIQTQRNNEILDKLNSGELSIQEAQESLHHTELNSNFYTNVTAAITTLALAIVILSGTGLTVGLGFVTVGAMSVAALAKAGFELIKASILGIHSLIQNDFDNAKVHGSKAAEALISAGVVIGVIAAVTLIPGTQVAAATIVTGLGLAATAYVVNEIRVSRNAEHASNQAVLDKIKELQESSSTPVANKTDYETLDPTKLNDNENPENKAELTVLEEALTTTENETRTTTERLSEQQDEDQHQVDEEDRSPKNEYKPYD